MITAQPTAPMKTAKRTADAVRKCIVTGEELSKNAMIRFVIAPDQSVIPDLAQNLPGRGLWITATHASIKTATTKNHFARAAKEPAKPAPDLAEQTAQLMRARCLNFLGLARSAGIATLGQMQVEAGVKADRISVLFIADDAGRDIDKLGNMLKKVTLCRLFTRGELGATLGYDRLVYVGLAPHKLTTTIRDTLALMTNLSPSDTERTPTP